MCFNQQYDHDIGVYACRMYRTVTCSCCTAAVLTRTPGLAIKMLLRAIADNYSETAHHKHAQTVEE